MINEGQTHESFGMLQFNRAHCSTPMALFGSSIQHRDIIRLVIRKGKVIRMLNSDHYVHGDDIIELEMSYSQFAEAITSMNQGSGVPVTLRWIQGEGRLSDCPYVGKRKEFEAELQSNLSRVNTQANELIGEVEAIFNKSSINKKDREEVMSKLYALSRQINGDREFIYKQFNEQMDKTEVEAKAEIEAFMANKINAIASSALVDNLDELRSIEVPNIELVNHIEGSE